MIALNQYGFGPQLSMKIYQAIQRNTIDIIQKNPYKLVEDVEGIGFGRADELGHQLGISGNHPDRIKAGCLYILETECMQTGHVYIHAEYLLRQVQKLLEENKRDSIEFTEISKELLQLEEEGKIIVEEKRFIYLLFIILKKGL